MKYQKPEVYGMGFEADGLTAHCDVDFRPEGHAPMVAHGVIKVSISVPLKPGDTIEAVRAIAVDAAIQALRAATR